MKKIIPILLSLTLLLTACSMPIKSEKKKEDTTTSFELKATDVKELKDDMFYIKNDTGFYETVIGQTNLTDTTRIAKVEDSSRIMSFTRNDSLIPTLYKDDTLVYSTSTGISKIVLERFKDNGWSIGTYNLQTDESSKAKYVIGTSAYDKTSSLGAGFSKVEITNESALVIVDRVGGKIITGDNLTESGVVTGLKMGSVANVDLYVGTTHYEIPATVDTHILSSMELYEINDYMLNPDGYAEIVMPDYLLSGYYFINGVGMFKYVDNDRSEGIVGVDFSVPYFYKDEQGKKITKEEYDKLKGENPQIDRTPSNTFTVEIDATQKEYKLDILYNLKGNEDPDSLSYKDPEAEIVSPDGEVYEFDEGKKDKKQSLSIHLDGMKSGIWTVNIYNLNDYSLDLNQLVASGNADSFIHSGKSEGKLTIHTDGISGAANAIIDWQKSEHAVESAVLTSPSGLIYSYDRNGDVGNFLSTYGNLTLPLESVESGDWSISIKGEDLGRVWLKFEAGAAAPAEELAEIEAEDSITETPAEEVND